jgi:quinol monooxygenase YgiN
MVLFGGTAIGAAVLGALGGRFGTAPTMAGAGAVVVVTALLLLAWPLLTSEDKSRSPVSIPLTDVPPVVVLAPDGSDVRADEPVSAVALDPGGTTIVLVRYEVARADRDRFIELMQGVERSRRRTGARTWDLYDDRERPGVLVEVFRVGSWQEHLSQHHDRTTGFDAEILHAAREIARSEPVVEHLVSADRG